MKLYTTTIESFRSKAGMLLAEGSPQEIADFLNSVGDGCEIGKFETSDLVENGGNWGIEPDGWEESAPFYYATASKYQGGFPTLEDAIRAYADEDETIKIEENPVGPT